VNLHASVPRAGPRNDASLLIGAGTGAVVVGTLAVLSPAAALVAALALALVGAVLLRPALAAYTLIVVTPLITGVDRGRLIPVLRPNEAIVLLMAVPVFLHTMADPARARRAIARLRTGIGLSILLLLVTGSVLPLAWMFARGLAPTPDDAFYAVVLWKYALAYGIVRTTITSALQVRTCLWLILGVGVLVGVVGVVQSRDLLGIPQLLATEYSSAGGSEGPAVAGIGATSTLGDPQPFGDVMVFCFAVAAAWLLRRRDRRWPLIGCAVVFALATVASAEVSEVVALLTAALALGILHRRLRHMALGVLLVTAAAAAILPDVVTHRLQDVDPVTGTPISWSGRLSNLETYFLPQLASPSTLALGVRPEARMATPDVEPDGWTYIESGHLWLLWTGGVPLLVAYIVFLVIGLRITWRIARTRDGPVGVAAAASWTALVVLAVITTFDPHLTMRGSADLDFTLLALAQAGTLAVPAGTEVEGRG
jgi:hypothetical protein